MCGTGARGLEKPVLDKPVITATVTPTAAAIKTVPIITVGRSIFFCLEPAKKLLVIYLLTNKKMQAFFSL